MRLLLLLFLPLSTQAAFVELDLLEPGDGLITRDTSTGLEWLDVTATRGLSFAEVTTGAGGWTDLGFGMADFSQVCGLFRNLGSEICFRGGWPLFEDALSKFYAMLTDTSRDELLDIGLLDERFGGADRATIFFVEAEPESYSRVLIGRGSAEDIPNDGGNFLVRSVPEPSAFLVLLLALGSLRRKVH